LLATLKKGLSNTNELVKLLAEKLAEQETTTEIIRLVDYTILPGTRSNMGKGDQWPKKILPKLLAVDIIIFATPIWWGSHSSVMQRAIERMDELNDDLLETGVSPLANKVGGMVITGAEDGAQSIVANLCNFMSWNGLTIPPTPSLSYLGEPGETAKQVHKAFRADPYPAMAKTMAQNLVHAARLLKGSPYPTNEGVTSQNLRG